MEISNILGSLSPSDIENLKQAAAELLEGDEGNENPLSSFDFSALSSLMTAKEDERTKLLQALKPMLSEQRQQRADKAIQLMRLAGMLPALQKSGLLEKLLGGDNGLL